MYRTLFVLSALYLIACQTKESQSLTIAHSVAAPVNTKLEPTVPKAFPGLGYYEWQLVAITSSDKANSVQLPSGVAVDRFYMWFNKDRLSIKGDCNRMGAHVKMQPDGTFKIDGFRMTQTGCSQGLNQADNMIASALSGAQRYDIVQRAKQYHLRIKTKAGVQFHFIGHPTPELEYGEGTRRFIEIKMSTKPCRDKPCLRWRAFSYAEDYSKIPVSDTWQSIYPGIQGFKPEPNHNYVVRLKEYQTPRGPLWVHDLTVEVEAQTLTEATETLRAP